MKKIIGKEYTAEALLGRANIFRWLAQGLIYPYAGHRRAFLSGLPKEKMGTDLALHRIKPSLNRINRSWRRASATELEYEYHRLFLGNGPCLLHETAYGDARRMAGRPAELADISGFYSAFGLELSESDPDLPDHLGAELEFYSLLLVKQAYARSRTWRAKRRLTENAGRVFLEYHLGRWIGALADSLQEAGAAPPYRELVRAADILVKTECQRTGAHPTITGCRLSNDEMQEEEFVCPHEKEHTNCP